MIDGSPIGVGIVGLGDGGISNMQSLMAISRRGTAGGSGADTCNVVALCDTNEVRLDRLAAELRAPVARYQNAAELVTDSAVDLVVIATPDHDHLALTQRALSAGKHTFVEKPVATTVADLHDFQRLVTQHPGKLLFSEKYSFARPIQATLSCRDRLGRFCWGTTLYTMWQCDRIMGQGGWRVHTRYNPVAGGLSHNFMTALLFDETRISRVRASGRVLTYRELEEHGGFDTMEGTLQFASGAYLNWVVCLAVRGSSSPFGYRTIAHTFQFEGGALIYGPLPSGDRLILDGGEVVPFEPEPGAGEPWARYNIGELYGRMHRDVLAAVRGGSPRHTIEQGINVAAACVLAFESAHQDGGWREVPF